MTKGREGAASHIRNYISTNSLAFQVRGETSKHRQNEASQKNESAVASVSLILILIRILSPLLHLHPDSVFPTL